MEMKERKVHYQIHNKLNLAIFNVGVNDWQKKISFLLIYEFRKSQ